MRIILFTRHYPPAISGLAPRTSGLARALRSDGHEVFVIAPNLPLEEPGLAIPHPNRDPSSSPTPVRGSHLKAVSREILLWPDPDIRWARRAAHKAAATGITADWVISFSPSESVHTGAAILARTIGARHAADFTDLWLENPHRHERKNPFRRYAELFYARYTVPKIDLVTATDDTIANELKRFGALCPQVIGHFPADIVPAHKDLPSETINVVHTGAFSLSAPENNITPLLAAFNDAYELNRRLSLHLIGRLTEEEVEACHKTKAHEQIHIYGPVSLAESRGFQEASDALIFTCPEKLHVPPSKIVEYLILDKPIIATGEGPWREDPRCPQGSPVNALVTLVKGGSRKDQLPQPITAFEAAGTLVTLMLENMATS